MHHVYIVDTYYRPIAKLFIQKVVRLANLSKSTSICLNVARDYVRNYMDLDGRKAYIMLV